MDYERSALIYLLMVTAFAVVSCANSQTESRTSPPEISKWVAGDADIVEAFTSEPAECIVWPETQEARDQIILGRAAFRSPYLLGGQAARRGISCNACHTNGGVNEYFFIPGLSDEPGTADVSNFHFSKTLGDGIFNPKPIPALATLKTPETQAEESARTAFILRLIKQEFDGAAPSETVEQALIAYVGALDHTACSTAVQNGDAMLEHRLDIISSGLVLAAKTDDHLTRDFLMASLRAELGRLYSRFPSSPKLQTSLKSMSAALTENTADIEAAQTIWYELAPALKDAYSISLFNKNAVLGR